MRRPVPPPARLVVLVALVCSALAGVAMVGGAQLLTPALARSTPSDAAALDQGPRRPDGVNAPVATAPAKRPRSVDGAPVLPPAWLPAPLAALVALAVTWLAVDHCDRRPRLDLRSRPLGSRAPPRSLAAA